MAPRDIRRRAGFRPRAEGVPPPVYDKGGKAPEAVGPGSRRVPPPAYHKQGPLPEPRFDERGRVPPPVYEKKRR